MQTIKYHYSQTSSQLASALESTQAAELAISIKYCLTEKQASPIVCTKKTEFMNMHKVLLLKTIAAVVSGAEQTGWEHSSSSPSAGSLWKAAIICQVPRTLPLAGALSIETCRILHIPHPSHLGQSRKQKSEVKTTLPRATQWFLQGHQPMWLPHFRCLGGPEVDQSLSKNNPSA